MLLARSVLFVCHHFPPNGMAKTKHVHRFPIPFTQLNKYQQNSKNHISFETSLNVEHRTVICFPLVLANKKLSTLRPKINAWSYVISHVTLRLFQKRYTVDFRRSTTYLRESSKVSMFVRLLDYMPCIKYKHFVMSMLIYELVG